MTILFNGSTVFWIALICLAVGGILGAAAGIEVNQKANNLLKKKKT